jgi:HSP20 family protein
MGASYWSAQEPTMTAKEVHTLLTFDPFAPLFTRPFERAGAFLPPADVTVGEKDLVLTLDLPGLTTDDVELEVADGFLFVRGERKRPELAENAVWAHAERGFGPFERRIRLPQGVDADAITASMDNGVLSLIVPKPVKQKKTIAIGSGTEQRELEETTA